MNMTKEQEKIIISLLGFELRDEQEKQWSEYLVNNFIFDKEDFLTDIEKYFPEIFKQYNDITLIDNLLKKIEIWEKQGIKFILLGTKRYPESLRNIFDPPKILFYKGIWKEDYDFNFSVAIVGSRKAEFEQSRFVIELSKNLSKLNICIVSGLALGIDSVAHQGAISVDNDFPTIAVLGNGLNNIYPAVHKYLAKKILDNGGVILSQFLPDTPPLPYNFLNRNRVISGLSRIVIVAQAAMKSGALCTARYALEQGKDLLSIVGPINNENFLGSNNLLVQGAMPITCIEDFFKYYPEFLKDEKLEFVTKIPKDKNEKKVYEYIKGKKKVSRSELSCKFGDENLSYIILNLESENYIECLPGGDFVLA